jgi:hypothetical protein
MDTHLLSKIIVFSLSLGGLWILYHWLYKEYAVDKFRQDIFALRDELFAEAAGGLIDFNHPAYTTIRRMMNGSIRFSHRINLLGILLFALQIRRSSYLKESKYSFDARMNTVSANLPQSTNERLKYYKKKMDVLFGWHIVRTSPCFILFFITLAVATVIPLFLIVFLHTRIQRVILIFVQHNISTLESAAMAYGR